MYNSNAIQAISTAVLGAYDLGIIPNLSIPISIRGGMKIVMFRKMRLMAVWSTAVWAPSLDFSCSTIVSLPYASLCFENKLTPLLISGYLMNHVLRKPAVAQAKKALTVLSMISLAPVALFE